MKRREASLKIQMMLAPGDDVDEIVTRRDRGGRQKQEDLGEVTRRARVPGGLREMLVRTAKRACEISPSKIAYMITPNHRVRGITSPVKTRSLPLGR